MEHNGKGIVRFWRGTRAKYNSLGSWDYNTRYSVEEPDGRRTEYFGTKPITPVTGELFPVIAKLTSLPSTFSVGDRYLVGNDTAGYYVVEIAADKTQSTINPLGNHSVRVLYTDASKTTEDGRTYQMVGGVLTTFDIDEVIDCGTF